MSEITPTRTAFLELQEERRGMDEGYRFLDEKRLVLAAEILRVLGEYEQAWGELSRRYTKAAKALMEAVSRHGLEGMQIYPPMRYATAELETRGHSVLGVVVQEVELVLEPADLSGNRAPGNCAGSPARQFVAAVRGIPAHLAAGAGAGGCPAARNGPNPC